MVVFGVPTGVRRAFGIGEVFLRSRRTGAMILGIKLHSRATVKIPLSTSPTSIMSLQFALWCEQNVPVYLKKRGTVTYVKAGVVLSVLCS